MFSEVQMFVPRILERSRNGKTQRIPTFQALAQWLKTQRPGPKSMPWVTSVATQRVLIQRLDDIRSRQLTPIEWTAGKASYPSKLISYVQLHKCDELTRSLSITAQ